MGLTGGKPWQAAEKVAALARVERQARRGQARKRPHPSRPASIRSSRPRTNMSSGSQSRSPHCRGGKADPPRKRASRRPIEPGPQNPPDLSRYAIPVPRAAHRSRHEPATLSAAVGPGGQRGEAGLRSLSTRPRKPASPRHGQVSFFLCLPELRRHHSAVAGQVRIVRRVEYDHRGGGGARRRRRDGPAGRGRPAVPARRPVGRDEDRAAPCHRNSRARSGRGRRIRGRLRDADRRRARHRQVDAPDPGLRGGRADGRARRLCLGRGIDRPGPLARRPARAR